MRKKQHASASRSQRQLRVGEQIRHTLMEIFERGDFMCEELLNAESITVTEVRISPDLKNATAFVMPLGGKDVDIIVPALNNESPLIRKSLAHALSSMRYTPNLKFLPDQTFDYASKIDEILAHQPEWHGDLPEE